MASSYVVVRIILFNCCKNLSLYIISRDAKISNWKYCLFQYLVNENGSFKFHLFFYPRSDAFITHWLNYLFKLN